MFVHFVLFCKSRWMVHGWLFSSRHSWRHDNLRMRSHDQLCSFSGEYPLVNFLRCNCPHPPNPSHTPTSFAAQGILNLLPLIAILRSIERSYGSCWMKSGLVIGRGRSRGPYTRFRLVTGHMSALYYYPGREKTDKTNARKQLMWTR